MVLDDKQRAHDIVGYLAGQYKKEAGKPSWWQNKFTLLKKITLLKYQKNFAQLSAIHA